MGKIMHWWSSLLGAAALGIASTAVGAPPLRPRDMERLSPAELNRVLQKDLLSMLEPADEIDPAMFRWTRGVDLLTRPVGADFAGLCRREVLTLRYTAAKGEAGSQNPRLQAYGVEAQPLFHVVVLHEGEPDYRRDGAWTPECSDLGPGKSWFEAEDDFHAMQVALLFRQTLRDVEAGKLKAATCPDIDRSVHATCEDAILAARDFSKLAGAEPCRAQKGQVCYVLRFYGATEYEFTALTVLADGYDNTPSPGEVLSIAVEQYMLIT